MSETIKANRADGNTHPSSRRFFSRTAGVLATLALAGSLAACSDDASKATPEPHMAELYTQALSDASAFSASGYSQLAALRTVQAATLADEIDRICGTNAKGKHPENCSADKVNVDALGMGSAADVRAAIASGTLPLSSTASESEDALGARLDTAQNSTINALASVNLSGDHPVDAGLLAGVLAGLGAMSHGTGLGSFPVAAFADSAPLVPSATDNNSSSSTSSTQSNAASRAITAEGRSTQDAIAAATALLEQEYRAIYVLEVATGLVDDKLSPIVLDAVREQRTVRDQIATWLQNNGVAETDTPIAAPAYTLESSPSTSAEAIALIQSVELDTAASAYRFAQAANTTDGLWTAARAGYNAAASAAHIGMDGGADPLTDTAAFALPGRAR